MCIVVAAKGTDADWQRYVDVGSSLIRNSVRTAHQAKRRQVHRLLLGVEPWKEPLPQAVTGDFRFVGYRHSVGAETHANAAQECGAMLVDPEILLSGPHDFHGPPGRLRQQHSLGRMLHPGATAEVSALILVVHDDGGRVDAERARRVARVQAGGFGGKPQLDLVAVNAGGTRYWLHASVRQEWHRELALKHLCGGLHTRRNVSMAPYRRGPGLLQSPPQRSLHCA